MNLKLQYFLHCTSESPTIPSMKKKQIAIIALVIILISGAAVWMNRHKLDATVNQPAKIQQQSTDKTTDNGTTPASFNKKAYAIDDPSSIWIVVNKQRPLSPKTYAPNDLVKPNITLKATTDMEDHVRQATATALEKMAADAKAQGLGLNLQSGYRSYSFQVALYNRYVSQQGKAVADSQSARPGFSEHQTGFAADLGSDSHPECDVEACFGSTAEGKWLAENAYKYGFIIRYTQGNDKITGYIPEPWHVRYVGVDLATEMHKQGIATLEQFFGLPNAPDYN